MQHRPCQSSGTRNTPGFAWIALAASLCCSAELSCAGAENPQEGAGETTPSGDIQAGGAAIGSVDQAEWARSSGGSETGLGGTGSSATGAGGRIDTGNRGGTGGYGDTAGTCASGVDCCPDDPNKVAPGACGCGSPDIDSDSDGKLDCADTCPLDADKVVQGQCGCGVADTDSDGDGTADCSDACPADSKKTTSAGMCGCGQPDIDTDGDGSLDCEDACPDDSALRVAGPCGCATKTWQACLAHRYSFNDPKGSLTVADPVGAATGTAVRVTLPGDGTVVLGGSGSDQYIQLPSGILSALGDNVTVEAWVRWESKAEKWQRLFDFGDNSAMTPGEQGSGVTYFFMTPASGENKLRVALASAGRASERVVDAPSALPSSSSNFQHVAAVVDGKAGTLSLYLNGALQATSSMNDMRISNLKDVNNWLGRSQYTTDPGFGGSITEFRIYSTARNANQVSSSAVAGPDALPSN